MLNCLDLSMTGRPITPNDENRVPVPQHRTANEESGQCHRAVGRPMAALSNRGSVLAVTPRTRAAESASVSSEQPSVLAFIVAYHADETSTSVVRRIPRDPSTRYDIDVLVMSGSSADAPCPSRAPHNPVTQKYGGNLKLAYHCAIRNDCRAGRRPR
jgi:hypothetical protein